MSHSPNMPSPTTPTKPKQSRNRCPCRPCQKSKRKCDQAKPQCSRCRKLNLKCEKPPPVQWRRMRATTDSQRQRETAVDMTNISITHASPPHDASLIAERQYPPPSSRNQHSVSESYHASSPGILPSDMSTSDLNSFPNTTGGAGVDIPPQSPEDETAMVMRSFIHPDFINRILSPLECSAFAQDGHLLPSLSGQEPEASFGSGSGSSSSSRDAISAAGTVAQSLAGFTGSSSLTPAFHRIYASGRDDGASGYDVARLSSLWEYWINEIASDITPLGFRDQNPFYKYLKPRAETDDQILIAVLYLTHIIESRGKDQDQKSNLGDFLESHAEAFIQTLNQGYDLHKNALEMDNDSGEDAMRILTKAVIYCIAFMAGNEPVRLTICMEYAVILCQSLFKQFADEESFLYLVKVVGFMQVSILFSTPQNRIDAPDYLSVALDTATCPREPLLSLESNTVLRVQFRDLDVFCGLSSSAANILYMLGTLICEKMLHREVNPHPPYNTTWLRTFESGIDGLEARLRRHMMPLIKRRKHSVRNAGNEDEVLVEYLNCNNEAVIWSAWVIFLTNLKGLSAATDVEVQNSVEHLLDACAQVPKDHPLVTKMVFPLVVGGVHSTKPIYREFVLNRFSQMKNAGVTDVRKLCDDLERWWERDENLTMAKPFGFTNLFIF